MRMVLAGGCWWVFSTGPQGRLEQLTKDPQGRVRIFLDPGVWKNEERGKDRGKAREEHLVKIFKQFLKSNKRMGISCSAFQWWTGVWAYVVVGWMHHSKNSTEMDIGAAGSPPLVQLKEEQCGSTWHCAGKEADPETTGDPSPCREWTLRWQDLFILVTSTTCDEPLKAVVHTSRMETRPPKRWNVRGGCLLAESRKENSGITHLCITHQKGRGSSSKKFSNWKKKPCVSGIVLLACFFIFALEQWEEVSHSSQVSSWSWRMLPAL